MSNLRLRFNTDIEDDHLPTNSGNDARYALLCDKVEVADVQRARSELKNRGLSTDIARIMHMYHGSLGRAVGGDREVFVM